MKRVLLALVPVALLASASLAITGIYDEPWTIAQAPPPASDAAQPAPAPYTPPPAVTTTEDKTTTQPQAPQTEQSAPPPAQQPQQQEQVVQVTEEPEEPLPTLVVDKTPLNQAMADLDEAIKQAKLAITALDAESQTRYIQESVNYLAGSADPNFHLMAGTADTYKGVRELLVEARVNREAAEVQWIAAVQQQVEAKAKRLAELAQAGDGTSVQQPPASVDLSASLGPTGVLGTRGVRPEEQAHELVARAIKHSTEAKRLAGIKPQAGSVGDQDMGAGFTSNHEALQMMESVIKTLDTAKKILQIAIDR
jgi:hypothetical protein